jgi:hypothetical protein
MKFTLFEVEWSHVQYVRLFGVEYGRGSERNLLFFGKLDGWVLEIFGIKLWDSIGNMEIFVHHASDDK